MVLERLAFGEDSDQQTGPRREERRLVEVDSGPPVDAAVVALPRLGAQEGGLQRRRQQVRNPGPSLQRAPSAEEAPARPSPLEVEALGAVAPAVQPHPVRVPLHHLHGDRHDRVRFDASRVPPHQRARHDVEFVQDALRFPNPALLEELALAEGQTVEDHAVVEQFVARYLDGSEGGEGPEYNTKGDRGPVALYGQEEASEDLGVRVSLLPQPERQAAGGLLEEQKAQRVSNADRKRSLQVDFRGHRVTAEPDRTHPEGDTFADPEGDGHAAVVAAVHLGLEVNGAKAVCTVQGTQAHHVVFKGARAEVGAVASPIDPQGACGDGQDERAARRSCDDQPPELGIGEGLVCPRSRPRRSPRGRTGRPTAGAWSKHTGP